MQNLIAELERMCWHTDFNRYEALHIARQLDLNQVFLSSTKRYSFPYKTTFLEEAVECYNIPMIEFLLQNGADPNSKDFDDELILDHATDIYSECDGDGPEYVASIEYLERFIIMLVAYGGNSRYFPVKILQPLDKSNLGQYKLKNILPFFKKVSLGIIVDGEGNTVAYV